MAGSGEGCYVEVAQIESVIESDSIADDISWESVAFIGIHPPILAISAI